MRPDWPPHREPATKTPRPQLDSSLSQDEHLTGSSLLPLTLSQRAWPQEEERLAAQQQFLGDYGQSSIHTANLFPERSES